MHGRLARGIREKRLGCFEVRIDGRRIIDEFLSQLHAMAASAGRLLQAGAPDEVRGLASAGPGPVPAQVALAAPQSAAKRTSLGRQCVAAGDPSPRARDDR